MKKRCQLKNAHVNTDIIHWLNLFCFFVCVTQDSSSKKKTSKQKKPRNLKKRMRKKVVKSALWHWKKSIGFKNKFEIETWLC